MKTIAIDFDGVIHKYSKGWQDGVIYDDAFKDVFRIIHALMKDYNVFIFSTRSPRQIKKWLMGHCFMDTDMPCTPWLYGYSIQVIPFWKKFWNKRDCLGITKRKLPAHLYIDDRAYRFESWEKTLKDLEGGKIIK